MIITFDRNENVIGRIPRKYISYATQEESINGIVRFEFGIYFDGIDLMDNVVYVGHKDINENEKYFQVYKIQTQTYSDNEIHCSCVHIVHDELANYGYIRDRRLQSSADLALSVALEGSRWTTGVIERTNPKNINFYDSSRLEAVSKIIDTYNVELGYRVTIKENKITERVIDLYQKRGEELGYRYVYGDKALKVIKEIDQVGLYTASIGRGRGEQAYDNEGNTTGGYGRRINFKDVVWRKSKGDPVDKPLGQEYIEIPEMTEKYGYSDGTPRIKVNVFENIEDPEELLQATYQDLLKNSRPLVQFETEIDETKHLELGDVVNIIRKDLNIYYKTRIFKVERDILAGVTKKIELGDNLAITPGDITKRLKKEITQLEDTMTANVGDAVKALQKAIGESLFDDDSFYYKLKRGNEYNLPPGFYTFNRPIDQNPTKAIFIGAGKFAIANSKNSRGEWNWRTFGTGDGFVADLITTGTLNANLIRTGSLIGGAVRWDLDSGSLNIGDDIIYDPRTRTTRIRGTTKLDYGMIDTAQIADGAITNAKIYSLSADKITTGHITADRIHGGTINADYINVRNLTADNMRNQELNGIGIHNNTFDTSRLGATKIDGNSVSFSSSSSYITITDRGGRGQIDINGTIAARGSGYAYELNAGGLYGSYGKMIAQNSSGTTLYNGSSANPSMTIARSGVNVSTLNVDYLYVNGKRIT